MDHRKTHRSLVESYKKIKEDSEGKKEAYLSTRRVAMIYDESQERDVEAVIYGKWDDGSSGNIHIINLEDGKYEVIVHNMIKISDNLSELEDFLWTEFASDFIDDLL